MLLDRIRKLIVFPDSAKLKYMDDEDDMCILQSEHDLDECIKFTEHRKKENGNSGTIKVPRTTQLSSVRTTLRTTLGSSSNSNNRSKSY